jgi:hypothetical protein
MPIEIYTSMLPWISLVSFLIYIPVICYLDLKYRDIGTHKLWLPLIAVNIPVLSAAYLTGAYPPVFLFLSVMISFAWFLMFHHRGADCMWLIMISMFAVIDPRSGTYILQPFLMYLFIFTAGTFWYVWLDNRVRKGVGSFEMENGIPFLIPISLALIAAVVV